MRAIWVLLVLGGCYRPGATPCIGEACPDDAALTDDASDAADGPTPDGPVECAGGILFGTFVQICIPVGTALEPTLELSGTFSTADASNCNQRPMVNGIEVCVRWADNITIANTVVSGTRPLVLIAVGGMVVNPNALLDVSSSADGRVGPGAQHNDCNTKGGTTGIGSGGGAGGRFRDLAGNGGSGVFAGGSASDVDLPIAFRVGCHGGAGGTTKGGVTGGAIYLIAGTGIVVSDNARINASGGGGKIAPSQAGGGGGGSGGFIGFDSQSIMLDPTAEIFALGGGGSTGGEVNGQGNLGNEPTGPREPAPEILPPTDCPGRGGRGAGRLAAPSDGGDKDTTIQACGGGGGGGGRGFIGFAGGGTLDAGNIEIGPPPVAMVP